MALNQEWYNTLPTDTKQIVAEDGVADLPFKVKAYFARALSAERKGDDVAARENLEKAVAMAQQA